MKADTIAIDRNQYLADVMDIIPSNTIIFKTLTGIGATHLELHSERNSIIIEPNVPVIRGKRQKGIFGVMEGICAHDVAGYMSNKQFKYKKIMVTPESFYKIIMAADILGIDIYDDYFLLFDECDRTVTDVDYRESILAPMEHFFRFRRKAFISATAMEPSDPRFEEHGFSKLIVEPAFDNSQDITLTTTNHVLECLRMHLFDESRSEDDVHCVFFNSTYGIALAIQEFGIGSQSAVFCADKSVKNLAKINAISTDDFNAGKMRKYNFFTCRFFAAVDMKLSYKPHVTIVTDKFIAEHTMVEPSVDAVQILGRFRNGIAAATVISNTDPNIESMNNEEATSYLEGCERTYREIETLYQSTTNKGAEDILKEALELVTYTRYLNPDGSKNHFMHDHFFHKEQMKSHYVSNELLENGYRSAESAGKPYFNVSAKYHAFTIGDRFREYKNPLPSYKEKVYTVVQVLEELNQERSEYMFVLDNREIVYKELNKLYPNIVKAYRILGKDELLRFSYSSKEVDLAVAAKEKRNAHSNFQFIHALHEVFPDGLVLEQKVMLDRFMNLVEKFKLPLKRQISDMERYFEIGARTSHTKFGNGVKVREIKKSKHNHK